MIELKSRRQLEILDAANRIIRTILGELSEMIAPGVTTADLNRHAEGRLEEEGAGAAFKGYRLPGYSPFPAALCTSVNEEVVHGIPSPDRVLRAGDIVSLDFGGVVDGLYGDAAVTVPVGRVADEAVDLITTAREALWRGIEQARPGRRVSDISAAVQQRVESSGYAVVRDFVGHGIGRQMHEEPQVPNYVASGIRDPELRAGMVLAIEPMIAAGGWEVEVDRDNGWTVRTRDRSLSAHWELSVAVTEAGPWVLGGPPGEGTG